MYQLIRRDAGLIVNYCVVSFGGPLHKLTKAIILAVNYQGAIEHVGGL